jgi:AAA15 family ATPase/GTPase
MYVSNLSLINIRSFKKTELQLSKSINLLVGNNNSGKSTIIKSLFKLQSTQTLGSDDIRKTNEYARIFIDLEDISLKERETFQLNHKEKHIEFPDTDKVKVLFGIHTGIVENKRGQESFFIDLNSKFEIDETWAVRKKKGHDIKFLEFAGLPNQETHKNFIYPFFAKRKTRYYSNQMGPKEVFYVAEDLQNITSKVQKISNPSHPKYRLFVKHMKDILGFSVGVIPHSDHQSNTGIYVDDTTVIPIDNMGEGVVNIIGLIVMLLTEDRKLYLIEELENDIHPKALKKLLHLILEKATNNQFLISTHSNIVVKYLGIESSKIFSLRWQPYETNPEDKLPTSTIGELKQDPEEKIKLLEDLGYDIFDFDLYKSYLIFEESSAESIVKDFFIPSYFPQLKDKLRTIAASGADDLEPRFNDFLRLFVFIHQTPIYKSRAWVIADGDKAGTNNILNLRSSFPSWDQKHFIALSKPNIEEFYPAQFQHEFGDINSIKDKVKRRQLKIDFTIKVWHWIKENHDLAKKQFSESASEIIDHLKVIADEINN